MRRPTYTFCEIIDFLHRLDLDEMTILGELITEEAERYTINELSILHANFRRQLRVLVQDKAMEVMEQIWKIQ